MHRFVLPLVLIALLAAGAAPLARAASATAVISQAYAGGGNAGASYQNDFVELFNRSSSAIDLSTWTLQYAPAAGTTWQVTALSGTLAAGRYYLVQLASAAAIGAPLPWDDGRCEPGCRRRLAGQHRVQRSAASRLAGALHRDGHVHGRRPMIVEALLVGALAVAASPQRVVLDAGSHAAVSVLNAGSEPVVLDAAPAGYRLDLRGRPRIAPAARSWFRVVPRTVRLAPGRRAALRVSALAALRAAPGDHATVLVLASRLTGGKALRMRVRVGVVVVVRVPGRLVRRLVLGRLAVLRRRPPRVVRLFLANRGNVDEWVARSQLTLRLLRRGRLVGMLHGRSRRFLAGGRGVFDFRAPRAARGDLRAIVTLTRETGKATSAVYHLRL